MRGVRLVRTTGLLFVSLAAARAAVPDATITQEELVRRIQELYDAVVPAVGPQDDDLL